MGHLSWDGNSTHLHIGSRKGRAVGADLYSTRSVMMAHLILVCSMFSCDTTKNHWKQGVNF